MYDKQIRRRRAVLVLLVVVSLILLTDYFGSPSSSPLHSVQRGIVDVLSPVQDGASTVLSPVRDVAGWFSSTFKAKSEVGTLRNQNHALTLELAQAQSDRLQYEQDQKLLHLDSQLNLGADGPVSASVIGKNPAAWWDTVTVNQGTDAGVAPHQPVIGPGGLVGVVSKNVGPGYAVVDLLTSPNFSVGAMIQNQTGTQGLIQPAVGDPSSLQLNDLPATAQVSGGQLVVTSGFTMQQGKMALNSLYPRGIPIGKVSGVNPQSGVLTGQQVSVSPMVDLTNLSTVRILTHVKH